MANQFPRTNFNLGNTPSNIPNKPPPSFQSQSTNMIPGGFSNPQSSFVSSQPSLITQNKNQGFNFGVNVSAPTSYNPGNPSFQGNSSFAKPNTAFANKNNASFFSGPQEGGIIPNSFNMTGPNGTNLSNPKPGGNIGGFMNKPNNPGVLNSNPGNTSFFNGSTNVGFNKGQNVMPNNNLGQLNSNPGNTNPSGFFNANQNSGFNKGPNSFTNSSPGNANPSNFFNMNPNAASNKGPNVASSNPGNANPSNQGNFSFGNNSGGGFNARPNNSNPPGGPNMLNPSNPPNFAFSNNASGFNKNQANPQNANPGNNTIQDVQKPLQYKGTFNNPNFKGQKNALDTTNNNTQDGKSTGGFQKNSSNNTFQSGFNQNFQNTQKNPNLAEGSNQQKGGNSGFSQKPQGFTQPSNNFSANPQSSGFNQSSFSSFQTGGFTGPKHGQDSAPKPQNFSSKTGFKPQENNKPMTGGFSNNVKSAPVKKEKNQVVEEAPGNASKPEDLLYSDMEELKKEEKDAFLAKEFVLFQIPANPPPKNVCGL